MNIPKWKKKSIHFIQNSAERTRENIKKKKKKIKNQTEVYPKKKI